jgi:hypothetical protein
MQKYSKKKKWKSSPPMADISQAVAQRWNELHAVVNGRTTFGQVGVRDPENPCENFDAAGYDGCGVCYSDGHYMCTECSKLSPDAPRFTQSRDGRGYRLRLFWKRKARGK